MLIFGKKRMKWVFAYAIFLFSFKMRRIFKAARINLLNFIYAFWYVHQKNEVEEDVVIAAVFAADSVDFSHYRLSMRNPNNWNGNERCTSTRNSCAATTHFHIYDYYDYCDYYTHIFILLISSSLFSL